jgi:hypothetical protein
MQEGTVIADQVGETPCVFLVGLYRAERTIAHRLMRLANGPLPWPLIDPDKALPWVEKRIGFALAESGRLISNCRQRSIPPATPRSSGSAGPLRLAIR